MKKFFGYTAYTLCSLVFFLAILFPADQAGRFVEMRLTKELKKDVFIGGIAPAGLTSVRLERPGLSDRTGVLLQAEEVVFSPSIISLMRKRPNVDIAASIYNGEVDGKIKASDNAKSIRGPYEGFIGFQRIDLSAMDAASRIPEPGLVTGSLNGEFTFSNLTERWMDMEGEGDFSISSGNMVMWTGIGAGMNIPYDEITAQISMKNGKIDVKDFVLKGDLVRGRFSGAIRLNKDFARSRVNLKGSMEPTRTFYESDLGKIAKTVFRNKKPGDAIPFTVTGTLGDMQFAPK
ncbi:hypothetical protein Dalk_5149 [Desulfatibacillum aliphaticivorans]|uniref:Uncharacterized protein n=1 Tax=Desulfatibacillum aliphaticivorans TaxID=218208 RepID=B8FE38_DESAL|nr:type II secretion system protein GspN [Desulfatibacillum aliphaticivorans]ACL06819.1 hypothetical protein Dalk_5149 [Desulfatibacillum aliphaticivorans]